MTSPNYSSASDLDDFKDAANAVGLAASQAMQAEDYIQTQIENIAGPLGGVVSWITDGLGTIITDLQEFITTGETASLEAMAEFVQSKLGDFIFDVVQSLQDLLDAMLGQYEGDDDVLNAIEALFAPLRKLLEIFTGVLGGNGSTPQQVSDFWTDFEGRVSDTEQAISDAVSNAVDAAVDAVVDGMNGIGAFAQAITAAISAAIQDVIDSIFGDGGTKWGQELYVAAGPVTLGFNDVPLGFGMPFSGKITDIQFYSNDHIGSGSIVVETRKNGTVIHTGTWNGGSNTYASSTLNLSVAKGDRITFYVSTVTSQAANMSVSVMGRYV
ncbi:hypothetical protein L5G28_07830 [Gordonia sp. HY285]|uniref:hypothetical protein n=1 Tax=Gordonia liuliyuniae TaxID=2911517 RepID=UPI001F198B2C|nr:hypothetical protein [Gordonia liuliyuniae]MCF8610071.1 hypothetical protein [Gordonia liuliyuniae]